jgi:hypothetical protein
MKRSRAPRRCFVSTEQLRTTVGELESLQVIRTPILRSITDLTDRVIDGCSWLICTHLSLFLLHLPPAHPSPDTAVQARAILKECAISNAPSATTRTAQSTSSPKAASALRVASPAPRCSPTPLHLGGGPPSQHVWYCFCWLSSFLNAPVTSFGRELAEAPPRSSPASPSLSRSPGPSNSMLSSCISLFKPSTLSLKAVLTP